MSQQSSQQSQPSPPLPPSQPSPPLPSLQPLSHSPPIHPPPNTNKEAWPSLNSNGSSNGTVVSKPERLTNGNKAVHGSPTSVHKQDAQTAQNRAPGNNRSRHNNIQQPDLTTHNG